MSENKNAVPQLCLQCKSFFGNIANDNLCSVCFNKSKKLVKKQDASGDQAVKEKELSLDLQVPEKLAQCLKTESIVTKSQKKEEKQQAQKKVQIKKPAQKCSTCSKKIGMLGYACKHCSCTFCKMHRLPQDHNCGVDFISLGRKKLKVENPAIEKSKIERI